MHEASKFFASFKATVGTTVADTRILTGTTILREGVVSCFTGQDVVGMETTSKHSRAVSPVAKVRVDGNF